MGIRAYVQVKQPEYGHWCLSSWIDSAVADFLTDNGVSLFQSDDGYGDHWEIDIDDKLETLVARLEKDPSIFDKTLEASLHEQEYGKQLAGFLREGLDAAEKNNYYTISIDWF